MFLVSKLGEVSHLFPQDVENIREVLLDRGIPVCSFEALRHFSIRLAIDPSFKRDVTSLVQVVIWCKGETVDYMDLLGILVVAAAGVGPFDANDEQEESVRVILRFLTEIRRPTGSVEPVFVRSRNVVPLISAGEPRPNKCASLAIPEVHDLEVHPVSSVPFYRLGDSGPSRVRETAVWIVGAIALALALGSGWMLYQKGHDTPQTTAAMRINPSSSLPVDENDEQMTAANRGAQRLHVPVIRRPSPAVARHSNGVRVLPAKPRITEDAQGVDALPLVDVGRGTQPTNSASPAKSDVIAEIHSVTKPPNAEVESAAKGTPSGNTSFASIPSVRRRLPRSIEMNPPPSRRPAWSSAGPNLSAAGVVHPASIGMMASNLISCPAPAYPPAASQAQVQGEVTVRAVVDRDGNVVEARVVSGPELLRDVSLEAVQHWRYRPYMQGGKAVEVATTAILDFELP